MKGIAVFDFNPGEEALLLSSRGWDLGFADSPVEGEGFEPSVPRVMDGDLGRQVPALTGVFELARPGDGVAARHQGDSAGPSSRIPVKDS